MNPKSANARAYGAPVALGRVLVAENAAESPWNTICYEVALKGRGGVKLTGKTFEQAVANFRAYPRVPVVLDHGDTDLAAHPERSRARGWITDLRVGEFTRADGRKVAALEAKFTLEDATRAAVNADPPAWAFCSVTLLLDATDEESGQKVGAVLYSLSLTNNPALQGLDRIAATDARGTAADKESTTMNAMLALAAKLNLAAASEEEAEAKIAALAGQVDEVRRALKLGAGAPPADVVGRVLDAITEAATVATLAAERDAARAALKTLQDAHAAELAAARKTFLDALVTRRPELADVREALELQAEHNWPAFQKKHAPPSPAEQRERAKDAARLGRLPAVGSDAGRRVEAPSPPRSATGEDLMLGASALVEHARQQGRRMTLSEAIEELTDPVFAGAEDREPPDAADRPEPRDD